MKKIYTLVVSVFVLMSALLGWFLPLAVFNVDDRIYEGRQSALDIEQINLSYREDLSMNQKINVVNYEYNLSEAIRIDKGIFLQSAEVRQIIGDFLSDFTGKEIDTNKSCITTPMLVNLTGENRGTIVIWNVEMQVNTNWGFYCLVDDKTGAILDCEFFLNYFNEPVDEDFDYLYFWHKLVNGLDENSNVEKQICESFSNALYNHYSRQIEAKLISYSPVDSWADYGTSGTRIVFRDSKNYTFGISVSISADTYTLETI